MSRDIERLQIQAKFFENAQRSAFFGNVAGTQSAALSKNILHYKYFSINL